MASSLPFVRSVYQPSLTVADLLLRSGDQQADAERRRGEIAAQMWTGLGNTIARVPMQLQDMKTQAIENEGLKTRNAMQANALADQNDVRAGQADVDRMMSPHPLPAGVQGPQEENFLTPEGLNDIPKMNAWLASAGKAHLAPELLKGAEAINDSIKKSQEQDQIAAQHKALLYGDMAHGAITLSKTVGMPIPAAMDFVSQAGIASKQLKPEEYAQLRQQIGALPPDQQEAALNTFRDAAAKLDKGENLSKDAQHLDRYGRVVASNVVAEPNKGDYTGPDGIRYHANGTPVTGTVMKPQGAPKSIESKNVLLDGKSAIVNYDPATGKHSLPDGTDVSDRVRPIPPASVIINDQRNKPTNLPVWATDDTRPSGPDANKPDPSIKMTPNGLHQAALNFIANGQYPPTGRGSDSTAIAQREAITSKVGAIAAASGMDLPQLRAFYKANSGSLAQEQKAYDAASVSIAKADRDSELLEKVLPKIGDVGSPLFNQPLRSFEKKIAGNEDMAEFATRLRSVQNEYARLINSSVTGSGSGVISDSARKETEQLVDDKATVGQMLRSIAALKSEGGNRLLSQGEQIQRIQQRMTVGQPAPKSSTSVGEEWVRDASGKLVKKGG